MTDYRRYRVEGGRYFFTVNLLDRRSALLTEHIDILRDAMRVVKTKHPFDIDAMVVLPEHLHCIMRLPAGDDDFSLRWRQIKSAFSRNVPGTGTKNKSRSSKGERGLWQRRFWEHLIRDERDFRHHVDYVHFNPVKHGYVACVGDWPYSTFHGYVKRAVYPVDWGGGNGGMPASTGEPN